MSWRYRPAWNLGEKEETVSAFIEGRVHTSFAVGLLCAWGFVLRKGVFAIAQKGMNPLWEYAWKKEEQPGEVLQAPHPSRQEEKGSQREVCRGGAGWGE